MKKITVSILILLSSYLSQANAELSPENAAKYKQDLEFYLSTVKNNYAYFDEKKTNWDKVTRFAWENFEKVTNHTDFLALIERLQLELYDNHVQLLSSTPYSPKVLPSSADVYAEYKNNKATVVNLLQGSDAHKQLEIGDEILAINQELTLKAIDRYIGTSFDSIDDEIRTWALNVTLAGDRGKPRSITVKRSGKKLKLSLVETQFMSFDNPLLSEQIGSIGYIKFNNSLGNNSILEKFPILLESFKGTEALILDLRFTSGGGNSLVARSILGHFVDKDSFYQKHEYPNDLKEYGIKRSWAEIVSPLKPYYSKPVVVLVNQWTGSMGEGTALGFDHIGATVIGTKMGQLLGSMWDYRMPNSNIGFKISTQKMYHVDGTPREDYRPKIQVEITNKKDDEILKRALTYLKTINTK